MSNENQPRPEQPQQPSTDGWSRPQGQQLPQPGPAPAQGDGWPVGAPSAADAQMPGQQAPGQQPLGQYPTTQYPNAQYSQGPNGQYTGGPYGAGPSAAGPSAAGPRAGDPYAAGAWSPGTNPGAQPNTGQQWNGQQWTGQPAQGFPQQGATQGRPGWDPTQPFPQPGQPGRDPRAPLGAPIPAAVGIDQFQERRSRTPLLASLGVLALVLLAVVFGVHRMNRPAAAPTVSATPTAPVTPLSTAGNNALSVAFDNEIDHASGTWTITDSQWSGDHLVVTIKVHVDKGTQAMKYFAISNDSETQTYEPTSSGRSDDLLDQQVTAGQTATGTVSFAMPDRSSTIFLAAANGRQVSGLVVPA